MLVQLTIILVAAVILAMVLISLALRIPRLRIAKEASRQDKLGDIDAWFSRLHRSGKFNGVVLLAKSDEILLCESYGHSGAAHSTELTASSAFNLASVSKQFTAMGVVILRSQSKLSYDDKLAAYVPELSLYDEITVRHLLNHTSGLTDYMALIGKANRGSGVVTPSELWALYQDVQPRLEFEPGSRFKYSNAGYVLLAEIIERVSGQSFEQFMSENIFDPLDMAHTKVFNLLSGLEPENRVFGFKRRYWIFGGPKVDADLNHFDGVAGDGGIYSSAEDLLRWHNALRDHALVPRERSEEVFLAARLNDGSTTRYGFGWFVIGEHSVDHAGGWQGFSSYIHRNMERDELVVVLDNSSNALRINSIGTRFNSIGMNLTRVMAAL